MSDWAAVEFVRATAYTCPMQAQEFVKAVRRGQTTFSQEVLQSVPWRAIAVRETGRGLRLRWSRWPGISFGQTEEQRQAAMALRKKVADQLEAHPELWDQKTWSTDEDGSCSLFAKEPNCGTPACVAGWATRFVNPNAYCGDIAGIAWRALWCDGLPMPSFHPYANKERNLAALRAGL